MASILKPVLDPVYNCFIFMSYPVIYFYQVVNGPVDDLYVIDYIEYKLVSNGLHEWLTQSSKRTNMKSGSQSAHCCR